MIREAINRVPSYNTMIQQFHPDGFQRSEQVFREKPVRLTGLRRSRRVVVCYDNDACVCLQSSRYNQPNWRPCLVNRPDREQSIFK